MKGAKMGQGRTSQRAKGVQLPLDPMVPLTRSTGSTRQVRQSQIAKVVEFVQANPGYAALDISQLTHVPVEAVNWILDCDRGANNLARAGMVARPTRGPLPLWAQQVPPELLAPANPNALMLAPTGGIAPLDPSIRLPFARQEGETARAGITELMRFSGGSSPTRAKRANKIVETSISLICLKLQELDDQYEDLKEEALSIHNCLKITATRADNAENRAATLDELIETLNAQISNLKHQEAARAVIAEILTERLSLSATPPIGESPRHGSQPEQESS
jgi:hypothetical protein